MLETIRCLLSVVRMSLVQDLHLIHEIELNVKLVGASFDKLLDLLVWANVKDEFHLVVEANFELSFFPLKRLIDALNIKHGADCLDDEGNLGVITNDCHHYRQQDLLDATNITQDGPDIQGGSGELVYTGIHGEPFDVEMCIIKAKMIRH